MIVGAVVLGWLASLGASMISSFEPPPTLNALFLALAGSALAINGHEQQTRQLPPPKNEDDDTKDVR